MRVDAFAMNVKYQIKRKKSVNLKKLFHPFLSAINYLCANNMKKIIPQNSFRAYFMIY